MLKNLEAAVHKVAVIYTQRNQEVPHTVAEIKIETSQIFKDTNKANATLDALMLHVKSMEAKMDSLQNGGNEVPVDATPEDVTKQANIEKAKWDTRVAAARATIKDGKHATKRRKVKELEEFVARRQHAKNELASSSSASRKRR